jgi:primosomal protein N' (replication factor Y)
MELFEGQADPAPPAGPVHTVRVAVAAGLWQSLDYLWSGPAAPAIGLRVRVPLGRGNRKVLGFVCELNPTPPAKALQLKKVSEVLDQEPQLDGDLWRLAQWIGRYYGAPLGMALAAMVPSAVGRHAEQTESFAFLQSEKADWPRALGGRQRRVLDELLEARAQGIQPLPLERLRAHSEAAADTIRRLQERGLIRLETRPRILPSLSDQAQADPFELNEHQQAALAALQPTLAGGFSVTLLHGVTGSGKTEVYIRAIRQVTAAGKQAILLVPEIALATHTLGRLTSRLSRVAVLHSGLTGAQRAFYYRQIRDGHAMTVVGPRSAIFAPARKLGLIIVDEEHEPSYKQDTLPRYHGRDAAIMRGSLCEVPVILGSATPSLESLANVQRGRYGLLKLPVRVRGLALPPLELVELRKEITPGRIELIGRTLQARLAETLDRQEQAILLMNRRGYASYVFCPSCQWKLSCEHCSRAMVFHQSITLAVCHYCDSTVAVPASCPACGKKLVLFGLGIQRIESELARKFPKAVVARMDSDTMTSVTQFQQVLDEFAAGRIDILLGTQMVAKGLDFPRVSLVGVVSADVSLEIPDFRAGERTFQLIVQVAGRAGRGQMPGKVIVQTFHAGDPVIKFALGHDYDGFAAFEMPLRQKLDLPPFTRLVRFLVRHANQGKCESAAGLLGEELRRLLGRYPDIHLIGPAQAPVARIRRQYRWSLQTTCPRPGAVQNLLFPHLPALAAKLSPAELIVDADPINLM